jgi:four helix bundle protein
LLQRPKDLAEVDGIDLRGVALYQQFRATEIHGLTSQMRRAAVSVASNIAEGKGKSSDREFTLFL